MKITPIDVSDVVIPIFTFGARRAVKFLNGSTRIRATRVTLKGKIDRRFKNFEIRLNIGSPNYAEQKMIRNALKKDKRFLKNRSLVIFPFK